MNSDTAATPNPIMTAVGQLAGPALDLMAAHPDAVINGVAFIFTAIVVDGLKKNFITKENRWLVDLGAALFRAWAGSRKGGQK